MSNLPQLMPQIMHLTEETRWGRRATLLRLVAIRTQQGGDTWTSLGVGELMKYGRTYGQARWDHELLKRMASTDRILRRLTAKGAGRRADLYRIRGESVAVLAEWRHVPWRTSAPAAVRFLRALELDAVAPVMGAVFPGQSPAMGAVTPPKVGSPDAPLSVKSPRPSPDEPRPLPESPAQDGHGTAPIPDGTAPPSPTGLRFKGFKDLEIERGGTLPAANAEARAELRRAIDGAICPPFIRGAALRRVDALADRWGRSEHFPALLKRARRLEGTEKLLVALDELEEWAPAPDRELEAKRTNLRALIKNLEGVDPEYTASLREELAALGEEPATVPPER